MQVPARTPSPLAVQDRRQAQTLLSSSECTTCWTARISPQPNPQHIHHTTAQEWVRGRRRDEAGRGSEGRGDRQGAGSDVYSDTSRHLRDAGHEISAQVHVRGGAEVIQLLVHNHFHVHWVRHAVQQVQRLRQRHTDIVQHRSRLHHTLTHVECVCDAPIITTNTEDSII